MKRSIQFLSIILWSFAYVCAVPANAHSDSFPAGKARQDWTSGRKFHRGVMNTATGIQEVPKTMNRTAEDEGTFRTLTQGVALGVGKAIARTGAGIYEASSFLIPAPEEFEPIIQPEYVDPNLRDFGNLPPAPKLKEPKRRFPERRDAITAASNVSPKRSREHGWTPQRRKHRTI